jgi:hypothetical protein
MSVFPCRNSADTWVRILTEKLRKRASCKTAFTILTPLFSKNNRHKRMPGQLMSLERHGAPYTIADRRTFAKNVLTNLVI